MLTFFVVSLLFYRHGKKGREELGLGGEPFEIFLG